MGYLYFQWTLWMKMSTLRVISSQYTIFPIWVCMLNSIGYVAWIMYSNVWCDKNSPWLFLVLFIYSRYVFHVSLTWNIKPKFYKFYSRHSSTDSFISYLSRNNEIEIQHRTICSTRCFLCNVLHPIDNILQTLHQFDQLNSTFCTTKKNPLNF